MRKYYQAGLALITIVSVVSFLFYRHEYNKLHYVLEVFNYFGESHIKVEPALKNCSIENRAEHMLSEPIPAWSRLDDNTYIYSAHNINNNIIRAIALARKLQNKLQCIVYFSHDATVEGHVDLSAIKKSQHELLQGYYLNCNFDKKNHATNKPIGVKYYANNVEDAAMIAVRSVPDKLDSTSSSSAICIMPNEQFVSLKRKLSFVTIHNVFGVSNFVVYDYGLDSWFNAQMRRNSKKTLVYETVPWNFPFPANIKLDVMKNLVEADCMLRTRNVAKYSIIMQWTDLIVPKFHEQIEHLLFDLQRNRLIAQCYAIHVASFCITQPSDEPNIFKLTSAFPSVRNSPLLICKPHEILYTVEPTVVNASNNLIQVHRYHDCSIDDYAKEQTIIDESILKLEQLVTHSIDKFKNTLIM